VRPRFSIALLTEDKSEQTWLGLKALVEKLLRRFEADGYTRRLELVPADDDVRSMLKANRRRRPVSGTRTTTTSASTSPCGTWRRRGDR
jgi:hypothetical protein